MYSPTEFRSEEHVIAYLIDQIVSNGNPHLAGLEEEIIVLDADGKPLSHRKFQSFLSDLILSLPSGEVIAGQSVHSESIPVLRGKFQHGLVQPETNTTLVEYAHAPTMDAVSSSLQSQTFTAALMKTASRHGLVVIGAGSVPTMAWDDFLKDGVVIPNGDFRYSWTHMMGGTRPEYCRTVFGTASVHHNMGFNDPDLMAKYMATTLRLQPTMIALTGNAPLWNLERARDEKGRNLLSHRSQVQIDYGSIFGMDGVDYLYPDFLLKPATFTDIVQGYLHLPLDRTIVAGQKVSVGKLTMADYLRDGIEIAGQRHYPGVDAITMMLREPIVDVRPAMTGFAPRVETRAHDCVSQKMAVALDAFYRGVLANLNAVQHLMSGMTRDEIRRQRQQVCSIGLASPVKHENDAIRTQRDLACEVLRLSAIGLGYRGLGEGMLLEPLLMIAESGLNPAQRTLRGWKSHNTTDLLEALRYDQTCFADGTSYARPQHPHQPRKHAHVEATCAP